MPGKEPVFTISYLLPNDTEKRAKQKFTKRDGTLHNKLGDLGNKVVYKEVLLLNLNLYGAILT